MITLLFGDNIYKKRQEIARLLKNFPDQDIERYDGETLSSDEFIHLTRGLSLFSPKRAIVIQGLAQNTSLWERVPDILQEDDENLTVIMTEASVDKRTKTYKFLQKNHYVIECSHPTESEAITWLTNEGLSEEASYLLIERIGLHQMKLFYALEKIRLLNDASIESIKKIIDDEPEAKVFALINAVIHKKGEEVQKLLTDIRALEDPHRFMGLFISQFFNLITMSLAHQPPHEVARELSAHPYSFQKIDRVARTINKKDREKMIQIVAKADMNIKSGSDPWKVIEAMLLQLSF